MDLGIGSRLVHRDLFWSLQILTLATILLSAQPTPSIGFKVIRDTKLPIGPSVVPFCGLYLKSYKVIPKRNYLGAYG